MSPQIDQHLDIPLKIDSFACLSAEAVSIGIANRIPEDKLENQLIEISELSARKLEQKIVEIEKILSGLDEQSFATDPVAYSSVILLSACYHFSEELELGFAICESLFEKFAASDTGSKIITEAASQLANLVFDQKCYELQTIDELVTDQSLRDFREDIQDLLKLLTLHRNELDDVAIKIFKLAEIADELEDYSTALLIVRSLFNDTRLPELSAENYSYARLMEAELRLKKTTEENGSNFIDLDEAASALSVIKTFGGQNKSLKPLVAQIFDNLIRNYYLCSEEFSDSLPLTKKVASMAIDLIGEDPDTPVSRFWLYQARAYLKEGLIEQTLTCLVWSLDQFEKSEFAELEVQEFQELIDDYQMFIHHILDQEYFSDQGYVLPATVSIFAEKMHQAMGNFIDSGETLYGNHYDLISAISIFGEKQDENLRLTVLALKENLEDEETTASSYYFAYSLALFYNNQIRDLYKVKALEQVYDVNSLNNLIAEYSELLSIDDFAHLADIELIPRESVLDTVFAKQQAIAKEALSWVERGIHCCQQDLSANDCEDIITCHEQLARLHQAAAHFCLEENKKVSHFKKSQEHLNIAQVENEKFFSEGYEEDDDDPYGLFDTK